MSETIRKMIMEKRGSYILGIILILLGLLAILGSLAIAYLDSIGTWTPGETTDLISALMAPRYGQQISLGLGLQLIHYSVGGIILSVIGGGLLALKRRIVPLIEEVTVTLKCHRPSCGYQWEESIAKTTLESMGYPRVKSLARQRCAKCGKFIRPRIIKVKGLEDEKKQTKKASN